MVINGMQLPTSFVQLARDGKFRRSRGSWPLKQEVDAYGSPLELELGQVYDTGEGDRRETAKLSKSFAPDGFYGRQREAPCNPGYIPDIVDFSQILCFGISGDGHPFCFDFREQRQEPSIIWWEDAEWRRLAPSFDAFVSLFDLTNR